MRKDQIIALSAFLVMTFVSTWAQVPDSRYYHQLPDFPFVFVSDDNITTPPVITDSLFDEAARGIRFKVNRTELQPTDPFIPIYLNRLVPWLKAQDMELRQVYVKGAASPEGPYLNNVRLARGRTQRLIEFLNTGLGQTISKHPVNSQNITEDYALLVKMLKQAGDPDYEKVNEIWLSCEGDEACCKRKLMALEKGVVWRRLLRDYFPSLRQARVILWFARRHSKPAGFPSFSHSAPELQAPALNLELGLPGITGTGTQQQLYTRRHLIAIRTNLIHDLLYVPQFGFAYGANVQLEYYPLRGHYTMNAGFTFTNHRHWSDYKFFQIRDLQLELRRYFRGGGVFLGPYLSVYAEGTKYGIGFSKTKGWEGEGGGGGLTLGHTWPLNRKGSLRMEVSASLGFFYTRHDPYVYGNPLTAEEDGLYYYDFHGNASDFIERNHKFTWVGPTNAGIHLTYDIIYRKKKPVEGSLQKGGAL